MRGAGQTAPALLLLLSVLSSTLVPTSTRGRGGGEDRGALRHDWSGRSAAGGGAAVAAVAAARRAIASRQGAAVYADGGEVGTAPRRLTGGGGGDDRLCDKKSEKHCRNRCFERRGCKNDKCKEICRFKCCEYKKKNVFAHRQVDGSVRLCDKEEEKDCRNRCLHNRDCGNDAECKKECREKCCRYKRKDRKDEHEDDRKESKRHDERLCNTEKELKCYEPCKERNKCLDGDKDCLNRCRKKCCDGSTSNYAKSRSRLCDREKEKKCRDLCIEEKDCAKDEEDCIKPCRKSCCKDEYDDERLCNTSKEKSCRGRCFDNRQCDDKGDECKKKCRLKCCDPSDYEKAEDTTSVPTAAPKAETKVETSTFPPTSAFDKLCGGITRKQRASVTFMRLSLMSDADDLTSLQKPQGKALRWILAEDDRELCPLDSNLEQRYILAVLYFSTNGDGWTHCSRDDEDCASSTAFEGAEAFLSKESECSWAGIDCNSRGDIRNLELANNNLDGPIPTELQGLVSLDILGLENNKLSGSIPDTFNDGLIRLRLNNNNLEGTVSATLPSTLIALYLNDNNLDGELNNMIGSLPRMRQLQLQNNNFSGTIPASLKEMTNLRIAIFSGNENLSGSIPEEVCNSSFLSTLQVDCDQVKCDCCDPECTQ